MALEHLVETLRHQAEAEAAAIVAAARAEADDLKRRSEADLTQRREALSAALDRHSTVELALASTRHAARREVLEARQRLLERVFAAARAQFPAALDRTEYRKALPGQIAEALECLGRREGTLRCHPAIQQEVERLVGPRAKIRLVPDPTIGSGFKLLSQDGVVEIDGTLDDRLVRLATRVAVQVFARLEEAP